MPDAEAKDSFKWDDESITTSYLDASTDPGGQIVLYYTFENHTDFSWSHDERVFPLRFYGKDLGGNLVPMEVIDKNMARLDGGVIHPRTRVNLGLHLMLQFPGVKSDSPDTDVGKYLLEHHPGLDGFVIVDNNRGNRIDLAAGWKQGKSPP